MKIASRILNILVLLLAVGAAVCAFFLFQKREQITKGRQMMSEAVVKTVKTIDPTAKISAEEMSIAKPAADLAAPLKVLEDNTKKIVDQRNKIAAAVAEISNSVMGWSGAKAKKGEEFADYAATTAPDGKTSSLLDDNTKMVSARGKYYIERNKKVQAGINNLVNVLKGKKPSASDFTPDGDKDNRKLVANFNALAAQARLFVQRYGKFENHLRTVANTLQFKTKPALGYNLKESDFTKNLNTHMAHVRAYANERKKLEAENKKLKAQLSSLKNQITALNNKLNAEKEKVAERDGQLDKATKEIERLKDIIDPSWRERAGKKGDKKVAVDETPMLRKLRGKITQVNEKFGFVTINLGNSNEFDDIRIDTDTGKSVPTKRKVGIPTDAIMTVASSLEPGKADYICRLVVLRVGTDSTIANIVVNSGGRMPKVGDMVFFSESDVKQMKENRNTSKTTDSKTSSKASKTAEEDALLGL
ncbi:MAG: hypothetical protein IKB16_06275 [Lentisphaeria bacterium]|nr:hypothetical protein [Lentisphaeria bacterium]